MALNKRKVYTPWGNPMSAAFTGIERASEFWPLAILVSLAFTSKKQASQGDSGSEGIWEGKTNSVLPSTTPSFFPRSPGGRRTTPATEGLEQPTLTDSGFNDF